MSGKVQKLHYDDLDKFTPAELGLIVQNKAIFEINDADNCPKCGENKSVNLGPCLACITKSFQEKKPLPTKHLPDFWPANADTILMARRIIKEREHKHADAAAIAYLFRAKHAETNGKIKLGACKKQSPTEKLLHGWDYIIEIAWDMWAFFTERQREALLFHELCHVERFDDVWKIRSHNVEEFTPVIQVYGLWKPDLESFAAVIREAEGMTEDERQHSIPGM